MTTNDDVRAMERLWRADALRHRDQARFHQLLAVISREAAARSTARADGHEREWRVHTAAAERLEAATVQAQGVAQRSEQARLAANSKECVCPEDQPPPPKNQRALAAPRTKT